MHHDKHLRDRNLRDDLFTWDELQKKIDGIPPITGNASISYSGGLDSTVVAYLAGRETGGRLHLITMVHDYGSLFNHWAGRHVRDLKRIFGDERIIHRYVNHTDVFNEITVKTLIPDMMKYGHFIWCLGCNLALMTKVIINNLLYSIPNHLYCSSVGGDYAIMSMPVTHDAWKSMYAEYGIEFRTPLLDADIAKGEERAIMRKAGIWVGYRFRRGVHGVQPICLPGLQHILDVLVDFHTTYDRNKVSDYIRSRWPMMKSIVADVIARRGLDLEELIARNKRQLEAGEEKSGQVDSPVKAPTTSAGANDKKKAKAAKKAKASSGKTKASSGKTKASSGKTKASSGKTKKKDRKKSAPKKTRSKSTKGKNGKEISSRVDSPAKAANDKKKAKKPSKKAKAKRKKKPKGKKKTE